MDSNKDQDFDLDSSEDDLLISSMYYGLMLEDSGVETDDRSVDGRESEITPSLKNESRKDNDHLDVAVVDADTAICVEYHKDFKNCPGVQVLGPEEIDQYMVDCIDDVSYVVEMPTTISRILLHHFKWDKTRLIERFYEDEPDRFFAKAGVVNPFEKLDTSTTIVVNETEECGICLETDLPLTGLDCGHRFCNECWCLYLTNKIMEEGVGQTIVCPAVKCGIFVDDATVTRSVDDPKVKLRYRMLVKNSFVARNRLLTWCPSGHCTNAIRVPDADSMRRVTCKCGRVFCSSCGDNWHDPIECALLKKWTKRCVEDAETSKWLAANSKECPKCLASIEKNGGCNHIICSNSSCNYEFCWVCLGPWLRHTRHIFSGNEAANNNKNTNGYIFYCARYNDHLQSSKLEHKLYALVETKMEDAQRRQGLGWTNVQFLKNAVDVLVQCRQTLMYTYAFAFYLRKNNQSAIFEGNQWDLESATETLSGYLERDLLVTKDFAALKQKIQDKSRYCKRRRQVLLDHVHEGYDNDTWNYKNI